MDFEKLVRTLGSLRGRRGLVILGVAFAAFALVTLAGLKNVVLTGAVILLAFVVLGMVIWAAKEEKSTAPEAGGSTKLERLIVDSLEPPRVRTLPGPTGIQVTEYVNFRATSTIDSNRQALVEALSSRIREDLDLKNWDAVVVPVRGNVLLGTGVAAVLGLQPILVRETKIDGKWVESPISRGRAFLVDDVCAEGTFLVDAAEKAREAGFPPSRAFVVIERSEGNARDVLNQHSIELTALFKFGDTEFAALHDRIRRQG